MHFSNFDYQFMSFASVRPVIHSSIRQMESHSDMLLFTRRWVFGEFQKLNNNKYPIIHWHLSVSIRANSSHQERNAIDAFFCHRESKSRLKRKYSGRRKGKSLQHRYTTMTKHRWKDKRSRARCIRAHFVENLQRQQSNTLNTNWSRCAINMTHMGYMVAFGYWLSPYDKCEDERTERWKEKMLNDSK